MTAIITTTQTETITKSINQNLSPLKAGSAPMIVPADSVVVVTNSMGGMVTKAYRPRPELTSHVVTIARASTARSWLAMPNIGQMVRMPPSQTSAAHPTVT